MSWLCQPGPAADRRVTGATRAPPAGRDWSARGARDRLLAEREIVDPELGRGRAAEDLPAHVQVLPRAGDPLFAFRVRSRELALIDRHAVDLREERRVGARADELEFPLQTNPFGVREFRLGVEAVIGRKLTPEDIAEGMERFKTMYRAGRSSRN